MSEVICNVCKEGTLKRKKVYRLNSCLALIGYLLLIPSVLAICFGIFTLFTTGQAVVEVSDELEAEIRTELTEANVPEELITSVLNDDEIPASRLDNLSERQRVAIESAEMSYDAGTVGAGLAGIFAGGLSIGVIVAAIIGSAIGLLLTLRKRVLKCDNCGAVVAAS